MSDLSTLPKGDSAWLLRKAIERIMQQVSVLETNIGSSTTGNSLDGQIIFNDNGTLRGDTGLTYAKSTTTLRAGLLIVPGNTQLATVGILYVGTTANPKLKVDVGANLTTITNATITGALTVDTTTLVVDATNNRVGIGTASPQDGFEVVGNSFFRGAAAGVRVGDGGGYGYVSAYGPALSGAKDLVLQTGGGNVGVGVTPVAGSGAIQLNAGVGFPATQVASSDANTLDDYEEGTWTPVYSPVSGSFTTLPTVGSGKYRKIGDTVFFSIDIRTSGTVDLGGASGNIQITGFPFVCSSAGGSGTASVFQQFNLAVSSAHLGIVITPSTSIATISKNLSNAGASYVQANELSTATGSFENLIGAFGMYNV